MTFFRIFLISALCATVSLPSLAGGGRQDDFDAVDDAKPSATPASPKPAEPKKEEKKPAAQQTTQTPNQNSSTQQTNQPETEKTSDKQSNNSQNTDAKESSKTDNAEKDYKNAKDKETSFANRGVTAASMVATGLGGMQLAQGMAEQSADEAAERDMQAYLATFQCKVGDKRYSGGTTGIETPGANQLIKLYQEYTDLAADLKERKEALGMKPGIESQVVLDKNNIGLYDDVGHGIENGTYASLYRASRGNETDKQKLAEQKDTAGQKVKAGAIAAAAGSVGGMIGNIAINGDDDNDKDDPNSDVVCYSDLQKLHTVDCKSPYRRVCEIPGSAINVYTEVDCGTMTVKGGQAIH